eukprot:12586383-Alexandrium_andersonii.AAC.1
MVMNNSLAKVEKGLHSVWLRLQSRYAHKAKRPWPGLRTSRSRGTPSVAARRPRRAAPKPWSHQLLPIPSPGHGRSGLWACCDRILVRAEMRPLLNISQ